MSLLPLMAMSLLQYANHLHVMSLMKNGNILTDTVITCDTFACIFVSFCWIIQKVVNEFL